MYLLIKYIKSVLWRVAQFLSYIGEALCLKVNVVSLPGIEPQFLYSSPVSLVNTLPTPPCLPSCSNGMYSFNLIK